jgi:hypothetical protein
LGKNNKAHDVPNFAYAVRAHPYYDSELARAKESEQSDNSAEPEGKLNFVKATVTAPFFLQHT